MSTGGPLLIKEGQGVVEEPEGIEPTERFENFETPNPQIHADVNPEVVVTSIEHCPS